MIAGTLVRLGGGSSLVIASVPKVNVLLLFLHLCSIHLAQERERERRKEARTEAETTGSCEQANKMNERLTSVVVSLQRFHCGNLLGVPSFKSVADPGDFHILSIFLAATADSKLNASRLVYRLLTDALDQLRQPAITVSNESKKRVIRPE